MGSCKVERASEVDPELSSVRHYIQSEDWSTTSQKMIEALTPIFVRYGYPFTLKSENAAQFVSEEFEEFLSKNGIEHRTSPPLWPQANGEVERQNRTLLKVLKIAQVEGKRWKDELNKILLAYRTTPHSNTGMTPASLMFGRELKTKLPELTRACWRKASETGTGNTNCLVSSMLTSKGMQLSIQ